MRILLCNDDGIHARGIHALMSELSSIAEIFVAAPDRERSGTGHSITVFEPIKVTPAKLPRVKAGWIVGGTPVDCVKLAINKLIEEKIDLVVSGINHGPNLGTDVLYSGTVSAAAEGVIMGVPSIAVSLDSYEEEMDFTFAAQFTRNIVRIVMKQGIEKDTLLNINIPPLAPQDIRGIRITKLGVRNYDNLFDERQDPRGNTYYWLGGGVVEEEQDNDSDVLAVRQACISITPIRLDLTDYELIKKYKKIFGRYLAFFSRGEAHDIT
ncbi:MAG: 5'/3'-nucleotidase SurE [Syntrophomonadaceae bacterium]|nr:5'/3'-nucleotidase SurE [Syntrophomonadaceae bacterium]